MTADDPLARIHEIDEALFTLNKERFILVQRLTDEQQAQYQEYTLAWDQELQWRKQELGRRVIEAIFADSVDDDEPPSTDFDHN